MIIRSVCGYAPAALVLAAVTCAAQTPAPQGQAVSPGRGQGAGERGGQGGPQARGPLVAPLPYDDHGGFTRIFDGTTLKGWDGDPTFWRVEGGAIVGQSTPEKKVERNTFMIWRGGEPKDFELKVEFRMNSTNSGIQYRS